MLIHLFTVQTFVFILDALRFKIPNYHILFYLKCVNQLRRTTGDGKQDIMQKSFHNI